MLESCSHLGLEVAALDRARAFYADVLGRSLATTGDRELRFRAGETAVVLRRPRSVPRGGLHVHYALACPPAVYDDWRERLAARDPEEVSFGEYSSLYVDDPDGHCVEVGGVPTGGGDTDEVKPDGDDHDGPALTGLFEVVLEVADLDRAEQRYRRLGFDPVDRGDERRRVRLRGPLDLELWEPQLGLADARGGVHVDLGFRTADPATAAAAFGDAVVEREPLPDDEGDGVRVRDPDGHRLAFCRD
ncbi:MAG: VOC family protein [Halolamina sp.]